MAGNKDGPMPFREDCPTLDPPVDDHEAPANQENLPPTSQFTPGPARRSGSANARAQLPVQLNLSPNAASHRRSACYGKAPVIPELSSPQVDNDTGSPPEVRLVNVYSANTVRKRPLSAHGTSGHTSQADDDTSNRLPLTSSETDVERPDDMAHDGPRTQKKGHVQQTKRPKVEPDA